MYAPGISQNKNNSTDEPSSRLAAMLFTFAEPANHGLHYMPPYFLYLSVLACRSLVSDSSRWLAVIMAWPFSRSSVSAKVVKSGNLYITTGKMGSWCKSGKNPAKSGKVGICALWGMNNCLLCMLF